VSDFELLEKEMDVKMGGSPHWSEKAYIGIKHIWFLSCSATLTGPNV